MKRLADWRTRHKEKLAKELLSEPTQTTIGRLIKPTGVALIMGDRRSGKSVLAFFIMEYFHDKKGIQGAVCYPQMNRKLRRLLPRWIKVVTRIKDLPAGCVCIIDEEVWRWTTDSGCLNSGHVVKCDLKIVMRAHASGEHGERRP